MKSVKKTCMGFIIGLSYGKSFCKHRDIGKYRYIIETIDTSKSEDGRAIISTTKNYPPLPEKEILAKSKKFVGKVVEGTLRDKKNKENGRITKRFTITSLLSNRFRRLDIPSCILHKSNAILFSGYGVMDKPIIDKFGKQHSAKYSITNI